MTPREAYKHAVKEARAGHVIEWPHELSHSEMREVEAEVRLEQQFKEAVQPKPVAKADVLEAAKAAVADRGLNYGKPEDNFKRIAALWQTHLRNRGDCQIEVFIDEADVALMLALVKIARLENDPSHLDSWIDIAGYAACGAEISA